VRQNPIQRTVSLFICVCIALCTIVAHNIAQNRPDSFPPYPSDNHHCSDDVYLREGGNNVLDNITHSNAKQETYLQCIRQTCHRCPSQNIQCVSIWNIIHPHTQQHAAHLLIYIFILRNELSTPSKFHIPLDTK